LEDLPNNILKKYVIKIWRLKSQNACYHYVKNLLLPSLLSKNIKITIYWLLFFLLSCMGVKLGFWHGRRHVDWGCPWKGR